MKSFVRTVEIDMAPTFIIYILAIIMKAFNSVLAILTVALMVAQLLLYFGYFKKKYSLAFFGRFILVFSSLCGFAMIFVNSFTFHDISQEIHSHESPVVLNHSSSNLPHINKTSHNHTIP